MRRRSFIINTLISLAGSSLGLFRSKTSLAAWPVEHFASGAFLSRFQTVFANQKILDSDDIVVDLPEIAENGAVVPITISSELEQIGKIYLWVEKNPSPLVAEFELDGSVEVFITARIKMAESGFVTVIAQQDEQLLRRQRWVKVMQGGCGTG